MRKCNLLVGVAVVFAFFVIPLSCAATKRSDFSNASHSAVGSQIGSHALPFSFEQVLSYFDDAFGRPAYKIHDNTFVYIEGNAADEAVRIAVSATERKIAVTVITGGDWGVNYMREFFEAPFFFRSESEQLYALLYANSSAGAVALDRFDVKINVFKTREWIVIGMEFYAARQL
jgi:hypothetical protein